MPVAVTIQSVTHAHITQIQKPVVTIQSVTHVRLLLGSHNSASDSCPFDTQLQKPADTIQSLTHARLL